MEKEKIIERKCKACGKILPRKSRADKKTCDASCRKKYNSCIATVGNTEYKRSEIPKEAKELFESLEHIKDLVETSQDLVLYASTIKSETDKENYKEQFKLYVVGYLNSIMHHSERLIDDVLDVEITEAQNILDELDDRDNDRNDNLYS